MTIAHFVDRFADRLSIANRKNNNYLVIKEGYIEAEHVEYISDVSRWGNPKVTTYCTN